MIFTSNPGKATFLNRDLLPSEDFIVCSATVAEFYDGKIEPAQKHERLFEEMIRSGHWGCLDHAAPTFKIKAPIFVARQILRASGASFNEVSGRYKELQPEFYIRDTYYRDVKRAKLGEAPTELDGAVNNAIRIGQIRSCQVAWETYKTALEYGARKEQARVHLPLNIFTEFWMTLKLSDWLHFLNLRLQPEAQEETRLVVQQVYQGLKSKFPGIIQLWEKYAKGPINEFGTVQTP